MTPGVIICSLRSNPYKQLPRRPPCCPSESLRVPVASRPASGLQHVSGCTYSLKFTVLFVACRGERAGVTETKVVLTILILKEQF